jgi:hypothetical protein
MRAHVSQRTSKRLVVALISRAIQSHSWQSDAPPRPVAVQLRTVWGPRNA